MMDGQNTRDQIMSGSDRRPKQEWSNYILCIPFILNGSPNECWLHVCDSCVILLNNAWRLGLWAPLVAHKHCDTHRTRQLACPAGAMKEWGDFLSPRICMSPLQFCSHCCKSMRDSTELLINRHYFTWNLPEFFINIFMEPIFCKNYFIFCKYYSHI